MSPYANFNKWLLKFPLSHRQALYSTAMFLFITCILVLLFVLEITVWASGNHGSVVTDVLPHFGKVLGEMITCLCREAQAAVKFVNSPTDTDLYSAYTAAQETTDNAYYSSFNFIKKQTGMQEWLEDYTLRNDASIMTAQGYGIITRIRSRLNFNEIVYSAQNTRIKYMNAIKGVIALVETICQIYHEEDDFMGFSQASALSSSAYAVLQIQKHTLLYDTYLTLGASSYLIEMEEKEIIRYMHIYVTLLDLFVMPILNNRKSYTLSIHTASSNAYTSTWQLFNQITAGQVLSGVDGVADSSLEQVISIMSNLQQDLPGRGVGSTSFRHQIHKRLLLALAIINGICLLLSVASFIVLRFYKSKKTRQDLHNSGVMHDVLIRVGEYTKEIGTFGLSPPPPPKCMVEERRVGIVEQQMKFLVGSLKAIAPFLHPLLFPYNFKLQAIEFSDVKDPGTMVLTRPPRDSLVSEKLSLESSASLTSYFVPMAQKTDLQEQICDVALLYVTLSVFHELSSEEKRTLTEEYYQAVVSVIEECVYQNHGVLSSVAFERAVAVWNVANRTPNFCEQAAACALMLSTRLNDLRAQKKLLRENFFVHLGVVGGTVNVGIFGNEDRKVLSFFGPPVLRGMFVAQTNGYHMTTVACDDYICSAIQKMYYCKPIELIPEGGCVHQILHQVGRDDSELELQLATYCKAFEFFARQYHKSALKAFRAYTKQYGYDSSVERIQALIAGS